MLNYQRVLDLMSWSTQMHTNAHETPLVLAWIAAWYNKHLDGAGACHFPAHTYCWIMEIGEFEFRKEKMTENAAEEANTSRKRSLQPLCSAGLYKCWQQSKSKWMKWVPCGRRDWIWPGMCQCPSFRMAGRPWPTWNSIPIRSLRPAPSYRHAYQKTHTQLHSSIGSLLTMGEPLESHYIVWHSTMPSHSTWPISHPIPVYLDLLNHRSTLQFTGLTPVSQRSTFHNISGAIPRGWAKKWGCNLI